MTWRCHDCEALNENDAALCGSRSCQLRRAQDAQTRLAHVAQPLAQPVALAVAQPLRIGLDSDSKPKTSRQRHSYTEAFELWWKLWPLHLDKLRASVAFGRALAQGASVQDLRIGAQRYIDYLRSMGDRAPNTAHAESWLNGRRWEDEYPTPPTAGKGDPADIVGTPEYEAARQAAWDRAEGETG